MPSAAPQFVIIGAGKSASTWLHLTLRQHPAVFMPATETPFFEDPYYDEHDLGALAAALRGAPANAVVGIKCPDYLCIPQCAPRLAKHLPHARLIAILRNPVDRAISQYYHLIRSGRFPVRPADEAFARYLAGQFDPPYAEQIVMEFGLYAHGIANYAREFPREQLLILTDLDMRGSSLDVFQRACRFLEIDASFAPRNIAVPRNQGAYSVMFLTFIQSMNRFGQSYQAESGLETPRPGLMGWGARSLAVLGSRLSAAARYFVRDQEPAVSQTTRQELLRFYLPDIVRLEAMTHLDLSAWKAVRQG